jgi:hypothetical protein
MQESVKVELDQTGSVDDHVKIVIEALPKTGVYKVYAHGGNVIVDVQEPNDAVAEVERGLEVAGINGVVYDYPEDERAVGNLTSRTKFTKDKRSNIWGNGPYDGTQKPMIPFDIVEGVLKQADANRVVQALIARSAWFMYTPFPDDQAQVTFKTENEAFVNEVLNAKPVQTDQQIAESITNENRWQGIFPGNEVAVQSAAAAAGHLIGNWRDAVAQGGNVGSMVSDVDEVIGILGQFKEAVVMNPKLIQPE